MTISIAGCYKIKKLKILLRYLLVACIVTLASCKTETVEILKSREKVYERGREMGLVKDMEPIGHPSQIFESIKDYPNRDKYILIAGSNIRGEYMRAMILCKITIAGYLERIVAREKVKDMHSNIIRSLPISNAEKDIAEEYFFIQLFRRAHRKLSDAKKNIQKPVFSARELQDLQHQFTSTKELSIIRSHLMELKENPVYVGSETLIQTIINSFEPSQVVERYEQALKRWGRFQSNQAEVQGKVSLLTKKELLNKISKFLPENLDKNEWELWFNMRDAYIEGVRRSLKLNQDKEKVPAGILAFQELTVTQFIDLKKAFPAYNFIGFDALDGKCIAEHIEYDAANNKGPSGLGNLNVIMYAKDDFDVVNTYFDYLMPNDPKTRTDRFQHKFNIACFVLKHHRSGVEIRILNSHFPSKSKDLPQVLGPAVNFINSCTKNQKEPFAFIIDGNLYADAKEGLEGYEFLRDKLHGAIDWRYAAGLKYFSHPLIASTSFTGFPDDFYRSMMLGRRLEPKTIDMRFVSAHFEIISALNDGFPLNITYGRVTLLEAGHPHEEDAYRNYQTASDHTFSLLVLDPLAKPIKNFNKLKQEVTDMLAVRDEHKEIWYYHRLEEMLEEMNGVSSKLNSLTVDKIKEQTADFKRWKRRIERHFSEEQAAQPTYNRYAGIFSEEVTNLGQSNWHLSYMSTTTPMLPTGNYTFAIGK